MYKVLTIKEIRSTLGSSLIRNEFNLDKFKLCYITDIPTERTDWDEDSKRYMSRPDFSWEEEHKKYGYNNPHLRLIEIPNPDYIEGEQEYYACFTNKETLCDQWGDDWDDAPYEHNSGYPYDDDSTIILEVPFAVPCYCKFPCDYGGGNSPFSVEDINCGAVPWIFGKNKGKVLIINAGISPKLFIEKLDDIQNWK